MFHEKEVIDQSRTVTKKALVATKKKGQSLSAKAASGGLSGSASTLSSGASNNASSTSGQGIIASFASHSATNSSVE